MQGKAKDKVDLEFEENRLTPELIAGMGEEDLEKLYKYLMRCLGEEAHLTAEKKAQLATQAMGRVWMRPNSGPAGAEQFVRAYEKAYLLELRAGLVVTNEVVTAQRLFTYKEKLAPEVRAYTKGFLEQEQPSSLSAMHRVVRKWAEVHREAQADNPKKKQKCEQFGNCWENNSRRHFKGRPNFPWVETQRGGL